MPAPPPDPTAPATQPSAGTAGKSQATATAPLGRLERMVLASLAALLALLLLWLRGGVHPQAPLERLARQSPDLEVALNNGRPTLVEFYADWCEACRTMAPAMERVVQGHRSDLDVVLLNVDNPRWQVELERYAVNGIPQLELFDGGGTAVGRSIGARSGPDLEALVEALIAGRPLPSLPGVGATSTLPVSASPDPTMAGPRSHG